MNRSALERLCGPDGPLAVEPPDAPEYEGLVSSGRVRLRDASNTALAIESRFDLMYNASHALCLAALRRAGFRAKHRYIVFQVLPHTLDLGPEVWRVLDHGHRTRNIGEYEGMLDVSEGLVRDLIAACHRVSAALG
jgi:hypothetical protein